MTVFCGPDSNPIEIDLQGGESVYAIKRRLYEETGNWYNLIVDPNEGTVYGASPGSGLYARMRHRDEVYLVPALGPGGACPPGLEHPSIARKEIIPGVPAATLDAILAIVERRIVRLEQVNNELIEEAMNLAPDGNDEDLDVEALERAATESENELARLAFTDVIASRRPITVPGADCVDGSPIQLLEWKGSSVRDRQKAWNPILRPFIAQGLAERADGKRWSDYIYSFRKAIGGCAV